MKLALDLLPTLAIIYVLAWVERTRRFAARRIRREQEKIGMEATREFHFDAWHFLKPDPKDPEQLKNLKNTIAADVKRDLRWSPVIFFGGAFGLWIVSTVISRLAGLT
jgi:hypothetical protein